MLVRPRLLLPLVVVLALAGCTPSTPEPAVSVAPTADSELSPEPSSAPTSLVGLDCDELVSLATIQTVLAPEVVAMPAAPSGVTGYSAQYQPILDTALEQGGGISCLWANGDPVAQATDFRGLSVRVLPNAVDTWAAANEFLLVRGDEAGFDGAAPPPLGDASVTDCGYDVYYGQCYFDVLVGEYWVSVVVKINDYDYAALDDPTAIVREAVTTVSELAAPGAPWSPPAGTLAAPASCEGTLPLAEVRSQLGVDALNENFALGDLFFSDSAVDISALVNSGGLLCGWRTPDGWTDPTNGSTLASLDLAILPGGSWNWDGTAEPPRVDGLVSTPIAGVGDAAWGGCHADYPICTLHVLTGGTWFGFSSWAEGVSVDALLTLAHEVVD